jgi:hypothetical protein
MAKKKKITPFPKYEFCSFGQYRNVEINPTCQCFGCKMEYWVEHPDELVKAGDFVAIINHLVQQIDDVRSEIPREYDPQCD